MERSGKMAEENKARGLPRIVFWVAGTALVVALAFYAWVGIHAKGEKAAWWGQMGDSIALFSAVFNAGAMFAALSAVHLQRKESHESGDATREQLRMMSAQLGEFARAADAQKDLSQSQAALAEAQRRANTLLEVQIEAANAAVKLQRNEVAAGIASAMISVSSHLVTQHGMTARPVTRDSFNWQLMRYIETAERLLRELDPNLNADVDMAGAFSRAFVSKKGTPDV
jgi:hypothetical protein